VAQGIAVAAKAHRFCRLLRRAGSPDSDGWVLNGSKIMAMGALLATHLLVTARTLGADGISFFFTEVRAIDIEIHPYRTIDDRRAADIEFNDLRLPSDALLGEEGQAGASLAQARDEGAATICSEAIGCMRKVLADNVEYSKQRWQSGQPIGHYFKRLTAIQYEFGTTDQHVARYAELTKT
jgi:alkylation response protein AidB-like acyl-CoA dehydrogenase